jgi:hypothetical protein
MKFSEAILVIKEFFLDLLGYLIPGLITFILLFLFLEKNHKDYLLELFNNIPYSGQAIIIISYVTGYVIYGITISKDKFIGLINIQTNWLSKKLNLKNLFKIIEPKDIVERIVNSKEFNLSHEYLSKRLNQKLPKEISFMRSIAMSFVPEVDTKIYRFTFRAELSSNTNTIFLIFSILGILSFIQLRLGYNPLLKTSIYYFISYIILFIFAYSLHNTRIRFLQIAKIIIFTIYIAKHIQDEENRNNNTHTNAE